MHKLTFIRLYNAIRQIELSDFDHDNPDIISFKDELVVWYSKVHKSFIDRDATDWLRMHQKS